MKRGDWRLLIRALVGDIANAVPAPLCAARFHNALANWAADITARTDVILSGGCFQNVWLTRRTLAAMKAYRNVVYVPSIIPPNDAGLAVGQLAIGMARWQRLAKEQ